MSESWDSLIGKLDGMVGPLAELINEHAGKHHHLRAFFDERGHAYALVCDTCSPDLAFRVILALGESGD